MTRRMEPAVLCGLLLTTAAAAHAQPPGGEALAAVRRAGDAGGAPLLGFVADGAGHVVAHVVTDDTGRVAGVDFVVQVGGAEYAARGVAYDAVSRLGLLRITADPPPAPYPFALDPAEPGRTVYGAALDATGAPAVRRGSISRIEPPGAADPATIRHNALAGERRHGAPLFNNCGEAAGVIVERAAEPGTALAVPAEWVASTFGGAGLAPVRAEEPCPSEAEQAEAAERQAAEAERAREAAEAAHREAVERAERAREAAEAALAQTGEQAERAREEAEAAEAARAEAERRAERAREAERAAEAARAEAVERAARERAEAEAGRAEAEQRAADEAAAAEASAQAATEAEQERAEAEAARAEAEQRAADEAAAAEASAQAATEAEQDSEAARRYAVWAVAAGGLLSIALAGLWLAGRRSRARAVRHKRAAEAEAEAAREAAAAREAEERRIGQTPDVLLTGTDQDGGQIALRVPGRAIARPSGAVVGRSPFEGEVVLNHPEVSRRHFRLFVENGSLRVEDLGSLNGTWIDGVALAPEASRSIGDGAQLRVGDVEFTVQLQASGEGGQAPGG